MTGKKSAKILLIVEGDKREPAVMRQLFSQFGIADEYQIVSYCSNLYSLYNILFPKSHSDEVEMMDLQAV